MTLFPSTTYGRLSVLSIIIAVICLVGAFVSFSAYSFIPRMAHRAAISWLADPQPYKETVAISGFDYTHLAIYARETYENRVTAVSPLALLIISISLLLLALSLRKIDRLSTLKNAEHASPANRHPFGTSVMLPADPAPRAGSMPEASGDS